MPLNDDGPPTMVVIKREVDNVQLPMKENTDGASGAKKFEFSGIPGCSSHDEALETLVFNNGRRKKWLKDWTVVKIFESEPDFLEWSKTGLKGYVRGTTARLHGRRCTYYRCQFNKRVGFKPCSCEVRVEVRTDMNLIKIESCGSFPFSEHDHQPDASSTTVKNETLPSTASASIDAPSPTPPRRSKFPTEVKAVMDLGIQMMLKPVDIAKIIEESGLKTPDVTQISMYKKRNKRKLAVDYDPIIDANFLLNLAKQAEETPASAP